MSVKETVVKNFGQPSRCYGHCENSSSPKILKENGSVVVAFVCPAGYVSRVIAYGLGDNAGELKSLVGSALGEAGDLRDEDIRTATRYSWDMGESGGERVVTKVAYWTQNYRRTKSEEPDRPAVFACSSCGALFEQPVSSKSSLCPSCV